MANFNLGGIKEMGGLEIGFISETPGELKLDILKPAMAVELPAQYYNLVTSADSVYNTDLYNIYVSEGSYTTDVNNVLNVENIHLITDGNNTFEFNDKKGELGCVMYQSTININNESIDYTPIYYYFVFIDNDGSRINLFNTASIMSKNPVYNSITDNKLNYIYLTQYRNVYGNVVSGVGTAPYIGDVNNRIYVDIDTFYKGIAPDNTHFIGLTLYLQNFFNIDDILSSPDFSYTSSGTGTYDNSSDDIGLP